jgi:hypothetical protein
MKALYPISNKDHFTFIPFKRSFFILYSIFFALMSLMTMPIYADVISVPLSQSAQMKGKKPSQGSTKEQVVSLYGEPLNRLEAIGNPPITRWIYSHFTVFFEYNKVIHSVTHKK